MINPYDLEELHDAAKIIEYDGLDAYYTCVERYGSDIANALIVAFLRRAEGSEHCYPEPEGIRIKVNEGLRKRGLIRDFCPTCGQERYEAGVAHNFFAEGE
jgi:hypothetical protein